MTRAKQRPSFALAVEPEVDPGWDSGDGDPDDSQQDARDERDESQTEAAEASAIENDWVKALGVALEVVGESQSTGDYRQVLTVCSVLCPCTTSTCLSRHSYPVKM